MIGSPQQGDLILYPVTPKSAWSSILIAMIELAARKGKTKTIYSHVSILDINGYQLEAKWPRVARTKIDHNRPYEIWTYREIRESQRSILINEAYRRIGEWYDLPYLIGMHKLVGTEVCCTYAGDCYKKVGIHLNSETPDEIILNRRMLKIYERN